jgi:hypothetical protein
MKLDKIKFAQLVAFITSQVGSMSNWVIEDLDNLINIEVEQPKNVVPCGLVDELLLYMGGGTQKIEAIKAYCTLTGAGLKESKDAVERYWVSKPVEKASEAATLGDILGKATNQRPYD